jgi:hypothetical protein
MSATGAAPVNDQFAPTAIDVQAAIRPALRKRNGGMVTGEGAPAHWRLKEATN